jgi:hypothetical protein
MQAGDYQDWMQRAFLYVEAALATELATPSRVCMTEDYFRASLVRGLANSKPEAAERVDTEFDAPWTGQACLHCGSQPEQGRPIQHDVAVKPNDQDNGLVCEVKWLKSANAATIARDVWKLVLTRSSAQEMNATRCYMLLGGEADPVSDTLRSLRGHGLDLRWSRAGGQGFAKAARDLSLSKFLDSKLGADALAYQLGWGDHVRQPPVCWRSFRITRRGEPWVRTFDGLGWRAVLFELHHHGAADDETLDMADFQNGITFEC